MPSALPVQRASTSRAARLPSFAPAPVGAGGVGSSAAAAGSGPAVAVGISADMFWEAFGANTPLSYATFDAALGTLKDGAIALGFGFAPKRNGSGQAGACLEEAEIAK